MHQSTFHNLIHKIYISITTTNVVHSIELLVYYRVFEGHDQKITILFIIIEENKKDTIVDHIAIDALPLTFLKLSSLPPSRYEDVHSSGSFTRKWCMKAAFFLVNICWLASPMTPAPNLVLGGSLMNMVQKSVASITGSVPFLAEWAITSLRNAENNK